MYKLFRPIFFLWQPERIHDLVLSVMKWMERIPLTGRFIRLLYNYKHPSLEREVFGIKFLNPVGLAAGFDKDGDGYNAISNFGFGFVEIGTLTPKPQEGNPKPRCFRLPKDHAIINRMGINNKGIRHAVSFIQKHRPRVPLGCSIINGKDTPTSEAYKDYEFCFEYIYDYIDYFVLNLSCPNVKDAGKLQTMENLSPIIDKLLELRLMYDDYRPILIKISPDIDKAHLDEIIDMVLISGLDGIIATNTTTSRQNLKSNEGTIREIGRGGMSGAPLYQRSLEMVKYIYQKTEGHLPIIASGGIMTPQQALEMLDNGASLIEVYSGFIYNGPKYIKKINKFLAKTFVAREKENSSTAIQ